MSDKIRFPENFKIDPIAFYEAIVKSTEDYVYIINIKTDMALVSENMQEDFALPGRLVQGLVPLWGSLIHDRDQKRFYESIEKMLQGEIQEHNEEYQIRNHKNEYIWVICRGRLQKNEAGEPELFIGIVTDLSRRGKVDYVTGLFMQTECERVVDLLTEQNHKNAGILLLGLDNFSNINDLHGHDFGNTVLRQFSQEVQLLLPGNASLYRFDGDEFVIICSNASCDEIVDLYRKIAEYCSLRQKLDDVIYYFTVSGGIAMLGLHGTSYQELLNSASGALEASKRKGKNNCTVFTSDLTHIKMRSLKITDRLRSSVLNGMEGFELAYQPIMSSSGKNIVGAEALLRWSDPVLGTVSPVEFIPLLENSGLILQVGKWVLEEAVKQCKKWLEHEPEFIMNINCSYLQLLDESFIATVQAIIETYQINPAHIVLELTESRFVTDKEGLKKCFEELRKLNVRLAMDDFGTGYSSLAMLSTTPADIVKIDRAFISAISDKSHAFNRSFIGAVIELCHSVGILVCVEGVEQPDELETVLSLEADSIQGFYISKPISTQEFEGRFWNEKNQNRANK